MISPNTDPIEYIRNLSVSRGLPALTPPCQLSDIVVSFSGGKSSAFMVMLLEYNPYYANVKKHYVFANTGREYAQTILFIKGVVDYAGIKLNMIESKTYLNERKSSGYIIVDKVHELSMDGAPFESMVTKYGLPSIAFPHCTRELKINPIRAFVKEELGMDDYTQALGMRFDEPKRINMARGFTYPLFDFGITKKIVNDFWEVDALRGYALGLEEHQGNCDLCFKKSWSKLQKVAKENIGAVSFWSNLEEKYSKGNGDEIYREHKTTKDLYAYTVDNKDIECSCGFNEDSSFIKA